MSGGDFNEEGRGAASSASTAERTSLPERNNSSSTLGGVERPAQDSEAAIQHATEDAFALQGQQAHGKLPEEAEERRSNDDATLLAIGLGLLMIILIAITYGCGKACRSLSLHTPAIGAHSETMNEDPSITMTELNDAAKLANRAAKGASHIQ